jgi:hypothetical protein
MVNGMWHEQCVASHRNPPEVSTALDPNPHSAIEKRSAKNRACVGGYSSSSV